jgi:heat shock protein HtpX
MAGFKRIFLFLVVNILVVITISIVLSLLGVQGYLTASGIDYTALMFFCLVWGMGGSLISLGLSRIMAKWMMGVQIIDPQTSTPAGRELVNMVHSLAKGAGLPAMPQVGVYESPEVNAFATGPTKSRALVAVSTGLMSRLNKAEVEGVIGHEIAHIANGDMVTLTLIQGVINAFVMFAARAIAFAVMQFMRGDREERPSYFMQYMLTMVLEIAFSLLGAMVVAFFSRHREFRADAGGAQFAGRPKMIAALEALKNTTRLIDDQHKSIAAFKISGHQGGLMALLSTHPPLDVRIQRLKEMR